ESDKVKTLVDEMNLGSQEQARGTGQIGKAIVQMQRVTQTTAASAEQSAAAAEELTAQSEALRDILARLTLMVDGDRAQNHEVRVAERKPAASLPARKDEVAMAAFPLERDLRDL